MSGYNTLKQRKFKRAIRKGAKTIQEARIQAGYSPKSITVYQNRKKTQELINEALPDATPENITNDFIEAKNTCKANGDMNNFLRANEDLAKIRAMFTEKQQISAEVTTKEEQSTIAKYITTNRLQ